MTDKHSIAHTLKCRTEYFQRVSSGQKRFEIRFNDRDFQVGDWMYLKEVDNALTETGAKIECKIIYITGYEQQKGWVVIGFTLGEEE